MPMTSRKRIYISIVMFLVVFAFGVSGFKVLGGNEWSLLDCVYMTAITVATIGYGEVHDLSGNPAARVFTVVYIFLSLGTIAFAVSSITAFVVEGELKNILGRRKMDKEIARLKDHYIVCGGDETAQTVIQELAQTKRDFVVIETSRERIDKILASGPVLYILGDAGEDDVLARAGIDRARGVFLSLPTDEANLFVTVTARSLNPKIRIVAKGIDVRTQGKLQRAGADYVVSPTFIGGMRMASQMVRPAVVTFLDTMLRDKEQGLRVEEIEIKKESALAGKTVGECALRSKTRALLVAIKRGGAKGYEFNPPDAASIQAGDTLIFIASPESLHEIESLG
jgi:voltage-gated potassium channel